LADRLLALQLLIVLPRRPNQLRAVLGVFSKPQETPGQVLKLLAKKVVFLCQIKHICCPKAVGICWFLHWRMELPKRRSENANNPGRFPLSTVILLTEESPGPPALDSCWIAPQVLAECSSPRSYSITHNVLPNAPQDASGINDNEIA